MALKGIQDTWSVLVWRPWCGGGVVNPLYKLCNYVPPHAGYGILAVLVWIPWVVFAYISYAGLYALYTGYVICYGLKPTSGIPLYELYRYVPRKMEVKPNSCRYCAWVIILVNAYYSVSYVSLWLLWSVTHSPSSTGRHLAFSLGQQDLERMKNASPLGTRRPPPCCYSPTPIPVGTFLTPQVSLTLKTKMMAHQTRHGK